MRSFPRPAFLAAGMVLFVLPVLAQTPPPPPAPPIPSPQTASPTPPAPGAFGGLNQVVPANLPWMDAALDPDQRADMVLAAMTQDEKIALVHGSGNATGASNGGAGFVPGIPRLGLPDLNMADSSVGLTRNGARGRYSTLLPSTLGEAASWDGEVNYAYGAMIGREARAEGYNVSLAGGMDLARDPRNGRNFEYLGEDPVLAGESYAKWLRGLQDQTVIGDIKHYAFNDQETGRTIANVLLDERTMRESDLLAFEIGIKKGEPGMVMCSYNKVNSDWACENDYLLNQVLKRDWDFRGFVVSDWGATHSTAKAALAGLDQEQSGGVFFGEALKQAIADGQVPQTRLDDMVHRILRTEFASGVVDKKMVEQVPDVFGDLDVAQRVAEASDVLLKNNGVLPLNSASVKTIAVVGSYANVGVLTGGGSAQVDPPGGNAIANDQGAVNLGQAGVFARGAIWWPDSPMKAIAARAPQAKVTFDPGADIGAAVAAARSADVAIVFASQPASEGRDQTGLFLPDNQDALIQAVAAANPRTIVVLETGGPVTMPWLARVAGVVEIWFPGSRGAEALSALLFDDVNFTAKLPVTFPASEDQLPVRRIAGPSRSPVPGAPTGQSFDVKYPEKDLVGYKWYDARKLTPLFPFGFGLSYTDFAYSDLTVEADQVSFTLRNAGTRDGAEIAQVYATRPGDPAGVRRLVGFTKLALKAGESKSVTVPIDPLYLSSFDATLHRWIELPGTYAVMVGGASRGDLMTGSFSLTGPVRTDTLDQ
jgi:beta-glucosidase